MVCHKFVGPEFTSLGMVPVSEDSIARPDSSNVNAAIGVLEPNIIGATSRVGIISKSRQQSVFGQKTATSGCLRVGCILRIRDVERCIHYRDVMAATFVQSVKEFLALIVWITILVIVEIAVTMHVINIIPIATLAKIPCKVRPAYHMYSRGMPNFSKSFTTFSTSDQFL